MNRIPISAAASALLRALAGRAGVPRNRILLSDVRSIDWRSLTFGGERHLIRLRVPGPESARIISRMCAGLQDAEFSIPGIIVADIAVAGSPHRAFDGSTEVMIEALTISDD
jgi:hypothetical protein